MLTRHARATIYQTRSAFTITLQPPKHNHFFTFFCRNEWHSAPFAVLGAPALRARAYKDHKVSCEPFSVLARERPHAHLQLPRHCAVRTHSLPNTCCASCCYPRFCGYTL